MLDAFGNDLGGGLTLLPGRKGAFEVTFNGELIFSKLLLDRFPEEGEVEETVRQRLALAAAEPGSEGG